MYNVAPLVPTVETQPVAALASTACQEPGAICFVEPAPRSKLIAIPTPLVEFHVPEVSPGIVIVLNSQVLEAIIVYVN